MASAQEVRWRLVLDSKGFEANAQSSHKAASTLVNGISGASTAVSASTEKFGKFADGIGKVSTTLARSAPAFGLPIGPLRMLDDVADVAEIGLNNLTTSMVGLNAATIAVAGAGLAIGAAIGTWLRTFPAVAKAADDAAAALYRLFQSQKAIDAQANGTQGLAKFQQEMAASNEAALRRQVETFRGQGLNITQILDNLDNRHKTSAETYVEGLRKEEDALKKFNREQERAAELAAKVAEKVEKSIANAAVTWTGFFQQIPNAIKPAEEAVFDFSGTIDLLAEAAKKPIAPLIEIREVVDDLTATLLRMEEGNFVERMLAAISEKGGHVLDILDEMDGLFQAIGLSADSSLRRMVAGFADLTEGALKGATAIAQFASGDIFGGIKSGIGAIGSLWSGLKGVVSSIFGGGPSAAERLAHDLMLMRTETINAAGGIDVLRANAAAAGVSLDAMWNARTVDEYQRAVDRVNAAIRLHEDAVDGVRDAMERWGVEIGQLGPKFAQQFLHEELAKIYQDFRLLEAAGVDVATLLSGPMGDAIEQLVQQSLAAGVALPETMRGMIEKLIEMGQLTDAAGNQITDVSQLTFTETLEAGVSRLIEKIEDLVDALLGIPSEVETLVKVNFQGGPPPDAPPISAAEGFYSPALPEDAFFQLHKGERVEVTPAHETPARNAQEGGAMNVQVWIGGERLDGVIQRRIDAGLIRVNA